MFSFHAFSSCGLALRFEGSDETLRSAKSTKTLLPSMFAANAVAVNAEKKVGNQFSPTFFGEC